MKMYYVANFRLPSPKAYGIQLAKTCEALIEAGVDLTLVLPAGEHMSLREYYGLRVEVPYVRLPSLLLSRYDRVGYAGMSLTFMFSYVLYLWWRLLRGERFVIYTIDSDRYSSSALALVPAPLFSEMHGGKPRTFVQRLLFGRVGGVIAINRIIVDELQRTFPTSRAKYLIEPNGVDLATFAPRNKKQARKKMGLPDKEKAVLYAGRFYEWKGLEIIPLAAAAAPEITWYMVGGTRDEFERITNVSAFHTMHFVGGRPHGEMPQWIAAADALLVLGTKRDPQSYRWTSPMKLFEYLAAGRPVVASYTPAMREMVSDKEVFFYNPDDAEGLARQVQKAVVESVQAQSLVRAAAKAVKGHTWRTRADHVIHFIETTLYEPRS